MTYQQGKPLSRLISGDRNRNRHRVPFTMNNVADGADVQFQFDRCVRLRPTGNPYAPEDVTGFFERAGVVWRLFTHVDGRSFWRGIDTGLELRSRPCDGALCVWFARATMSSFAGTSLNGGIKESGLGELDRLIRFFFSCCS